jgi:Ca2+-binding EF-hand superfamily protein
MIQVKAEWAFKVFDYDGDNLLGKNDIWKVVDAITNSGEGVGQEKEVRLHNNEVNSMVENVLNENRFNCVHSKQSCWLVWDRKHYNL